MPLEMMDNAVSSVIEEDEEDQSSRYLYFRGRPLRMTGKTRSRYESSDEQIQIDYSKSLEENVRESLASSISVGAEESSASKQIRLNHLNNLVRLVEKGYLKHVRIENDGGTDKRRSFKESSGPISYEQILMCLRALLTDEEREIRAAALRVLRYFIQSDNDLKIALRLHMDVLIARCLDVVLDNRLERTQCIRLLISLIHNCPSTFPTSLVHLLLSICLDGQEENDKLTRAATAALCELVILNSDLVLECGGLTWLVRSILMSGQSTSRLAECLTTVLATVYNQKKNRQRYEGLLKSVFYDLLAPLMDENFKLSGTDKDEKTVQLKAETEQVLDNCRAALVAALRTWPGLIGCFSTSAGQEMVGMFLQSPIYALIASLCLESDRIRDFAVEAICEVLNVPYQNEHWDSWEKTLDVADCIPLEEYKYSLTQQFANADAACLLGDWNKRKRPCLTGQTMALVLLGLVDAGLINALTRVIVGNPNRALELKMTLVLSDILEMCGRYLPSVYRQLALSLTSVLDSIYGEGDIQEEKYERWKPNADLKSAFATMPREVQRQNAVLLAHRLRILSSLKQRSRKIRTLQMENLLSKFCYSTRAVALDVINVETETHGNVGTLEKTIPRIHTLKSMSQVQVSRSASLPVDARPIAPKAAIADRVHELVRDSRTTVPYSNYTAWDWSLIYLALCQMVEHRHHLDDSSCGKFTNQLIQFFDPMGGQFCKMSDDYRQYSRVGCTLMKVLGNAGWESTMGVQLRTFLAHMVGNLLPDRLHVGQLSTKNILNGSCADYFIFIGELSDTESGRMALERTGIMQRLVDLVNIDTHDAYIKLIVSSMADYDRPGMGRVLLQKALTSSKESARLYSTTFLSTLGKLKVATFGDWGMEMLINQLRDSSRSVVEEAARILEELINDEEYLDALIRLRPSLLPLGDAGILLLTYVMSNEQAVSAMIKQHAPPKRYSPEDDQGGLTLKPLPAPIHNFVGNEIERWKTNFNVKYARIVDERLCEAFSSYKRMADGSFPRHASRSSQTAPDVYVPAHLFGQLAKHSTGCQLLQSHGCLQPLLDIVHTRLLETDNDILVMKSALWALGNIASTELGFGLLPRAAIAAFVKLSEECPVLTVRGCAFYVVNLVVQSGQLARNRLRHLGWESSSPNPSLATFYQQQKRNPIMISSSRHRHDHSRRLSMDEHFVVNTGVYENDQDAMQSNLLGASVTSGGDILSSGSGSSPPRVPSPSIFLMTSPDASRKSSHVHYYGRRYRSHCSSGDAHSILTCASCELCRGPWSGWPMSNSGGGQRVEIEGSISSLTAVTSPIRVLCCEQSPLETMVNGKDDQDSSAGRKNVRSKSLGMTEATVVQPNYLTATNTLAPRRDRTPSPKQSPSDRKISVPPVMTFSDSETKTRPSNLAATYSIQEERSCDIEYFPPDPEVKFGHSESAVDDGFFARIQKSPDSVSACVRSAMGLRKVPMVPEDLPVVQSSFRRLIDGEMERPSEYITDENATGIATWRLLQKQQRERTMSLDGGGTMLTDVVTLVEPPGRMRTSRGTGGLEDYSVSVEEEQQSQSTMENSYHGDQSPSLQRMKLRPVGDDDGNVASVLGSEKPVFVCLPLDIGLICDVTDWSSTSTPTDTDPMDPPAPFYPARNHVTDRCLRCRPFMNEDSLTAVVTGNDQRKKSVVMVGTEDKSMTDEQKQQLGAIAFRKELLRLVTLLCVRKKYAEQGLLRLKQEAPQLFRSLCVYSDVSFIMSSFTFRLSARRFLQELFQDVDFSDLWMEPKRLLLPDHHHLHHHRLPSAPAPL